MTYEEAIEWIKGERSLTNIIPQEPFESWNVRIVQADTSMVEQAYWVLRAHKEGLVKNIQVEKKGGVA